MPSLTLGHKPVGKSTLSRAIKRGALSANRTETGSYLIDPAELERVYPLAAPGEAAGATGAATRSGAARRRPHHGHPGCDQRAALRPRWPG